MDFIHDSSPSRVIFAAGARSKTGEELDRLGASRVMVIATPTQAGLAADLARLIGERAGIVYPGAQLHTPTNVTEAALTAVSSVQADGLVAIGGGTAIGLSKAIALRTDLPQLVIPTTFAGSEMTPTLVETERGVKTTQRSARVLPETVIFDPELVSALPASVAGPSAMNAIANAVEALCAPGGDPLTALMAEESIRALGAALPRILAEAPDKDAWTEALYGSWLAGASIGSTGMGVHHKICDVLVGAFDLSHADVHCVMAPHTAVFARRAALKAMARIGRALGGEDGPSALYDLMLKAANHDSLRAMGLTRAALEKAADLTLEHPYEEARRATREDILDMLLAAYEGKRPSTFGGAADG
jgi:alcohol dehydrogenase class IV